MHAHDQDRVADAAKTTLIIVGLLLLGILFNAVALVKHAHAHGVRHHHHHRHHVRTHHHPVGDFSEASSAIVAHPSGCPSRAFCGCGAALKVFGRNVRELWLASNWFKFPRAEPAPGMVAVRSHHVMVIREAFGDGTATVYDANSGGHATRVHRRSLAGFSIRNPHAGSSYAELPR